MIEDFKNIAGFSDPVSFFKKPFLDPEIFKLGKLAHDLLQIAPTEKFHEARYDVEILENLTNEFLK